VKIKQLQITGPEHDGDLLRDYEALYRAGKYFRARINRFLHQNPQEPTQVYEIRKKEAVYRSYMGTVVDYFAALLFASPILYKTELAKKEVDQPEWFGDFSDDADGSGTDLGEFLRLRTVDAMVKRRGWWMLDFPEGYGTAQSKADAEKDGSASVTLRKVGAEQVLDCGRDRKGRLVWAIVHESECPRETPDDSRNEELHTWYVLDRSHVRVFQVRCESGHKPDPDRDAQKVSEIAHGLGEVPLVELDVGDGLWVANRLESAQLEHFRLSSGLNWNIKRTCYAMPVFKLADREAFANAMKMGAGYYIMLDAGTNEDMDWKGPPTGHLAVTREEIRSQKDEIFRLVTQMSLGIDNNAAAVGRSAESKVVDAEAIQVVLRSYGALVRDALKKTLNLLSKARGEEHTWSIEGLDKFDTIPPEVLIELLQQAIDIGIPSKTFMAEAKFRAAVGLIPGVDQKTKDEIKSEIEDGLDEEESNEKDLIGLARRVGEAAGRGSETDPAGGSRVPAPAQTRQQARAQSTA
jgi:hypothetical protein